MADPDLYLIARQYERIIAELHNIPVTLALPSLRDEVRSLREEMRLARADIARFEIVVTKIASTIRR